MPARERSRENSAEDLPDSNDGNSQEQLQREVEGDALVVYASDRSPSIGSEVEKEENFIMVKLSEVRKEVQCPICLGIIRKTRTVMECLHRFCRECIDKSMRLGNKECPACRKHCASRRSLRDDPNYDALIAALYPDIDRYEEEELAFHDEENARNKQIQASIKQTFERQSEALSKKRKRPRSASRRRSSIPRCEDDDVANNVSSPDESPESRIKRARRFKGQPSPAKDVEEGDENDDNRESGMMLANGGLVAGTSEMLAWGKGGTRSNTRSGSSNAKYTRTNRLARLIGHLRNLEENNELDIHIVFVGLEGDKTPALPQSHLCCRPAFSVRQLCEFIAEQTSLDASEVEILAVNEVQSKIKALSTTVDVHVGNNTSIIEACKDELQVLDCEQTLGCVKDAYNFTQGHMLLAYRQKSVGSEVS